MDEKKAKLCGWGVASLVCAVVGFVTLAVGGLLAVVFGHVASVKIKRSDGALSGRGLATAGAVLGYLELAFLVLFVAVIAPANREKARVAMTRNSLKIVEMGVELYGLENSALPTTLDDLGAKHLKRKNVLTDPWGGKLVFTTDGDGYDLRSLGPDGRESGDDIILPRRSGGGR